MFQSLGSRAGRKRVGDIPDSDGGGVDSEALDALFLDQRMTTLIMSDALNTAIFSGPDGSAIHDHFDSLTYVDDENATNLDISEAGALKRSSATTAPVPGGTGTIFGTTPSANALTAVFDGVTNQAGGACAAATGTNFYVGKTFSSPKAVNKVTCHGSNSSGYVGSANPSTTITLYGKQGSAPANATNGTSLGSITFTDTANEATGRDITSSDQETLWDHIWINITIGASGFIAPAELIIHEQFVGGVSVRSTAISASEVPTEMHVLALLYDAAGITLNTHTFIDVSRDGGTTWTQATLIELYTQPGNIRAIYTEAVDVTGQPSASSLKWRWRTASATIAAKLLGAAMWGRAA